MVSNHCALSCFSFNWLWGGGGGGGGDARATCKFMQFVLASLECAIGFGRLKHPTLTVYSIIPTLSSHASKDYYVLAYHLVPVEPAGTADC